MKKDLKNILVIGAGAYTLPKNFKDFYKDSNIEVMETDPKLVEISNKYFDLSKYDIQTKIGDARRILNTENEKYDLIFGDAYNSFISVPWYLLTNEWNREVGSKLNDGGIYAVNFIGTLEGAGSEMTASVMATFAKSFPNFYTFSFGGDKESVSNIVLVGVKGDLPLSEDVLIKKISSGKNSFLVKRLVLQSFVESLRNSKTVILTDDFAPVEKLMQPIIERYFPMNLGFVKETL